MKKNKYCQGKLFNDNPASCILGEMVEGQKEIELLKAKIPLNPLATPELIKELKGDDPVDCIFEVDYREGSNGVYADSAFESIVNQILTADPFVPAGYGHQSQQAFHYEGRQLYGTVIGALLDKENEKVYYRIIADSGDNASDVRRWLKNKQVGAVSIWGQPVYAQDNVTIVDYLLRSIDFVPPNTEGQKNRVLVGEMKNELSFSERDRLLSKALRETYKDYIYMPDAYDDFLIAEYEQEFYKIPYTIEGETVILGSAEKVRRIITYEPYEEPEDKMQKATNDELLTEIKARSKDGRMSPVAIAGEIGITPEDAEKVKTLEASEKELNELKAQAEKSGLKLDEAVTLAASTKEKEAQEKAQGEFNKTVEAVKEEKGLTKDGKATGEMSALVDKFARLEVGMSKEAIAGEMDRVINDEDIKKMVQAKSANAPLGDVSNATADTADVITF